MSLSENTISVAFHHGFDLSTFEISKIRVSDESSFVRSTFSPLVRYDVDGQLIGDLAEKFWWEGDSLCFLLRKNIFTSKGKAITSKDVLYTFIRSLKKDHSSHGSLKQFFIDSDISSIKKNIRINSDREISITPQKDKIFLLQTLAVPEMSIVPHQDSYDAKVDYSNTTGVYFVSSSNSKGIVLSINKGHHLYRKQMADSVKLVFISTNEISIPSAIDSAAINVKPTFFFHDVKEIIEKYGNDSKYNIHKTYNIQLVSLSFYDKRDATIPLSRRRVVSKIIKEDSIKRNLGRTDIRPAHQFFSIYGEGLLTDKEEQEISRSYSEIDTSGEDGHGIILSAPNEFVARHYRDRYRGLLPKMQIKVMSSAERDRLESEKKFDDLPDFFFSASDTGFSDNISLIHYMVHSGIFGQQINNAKEWLSSYYSSPKDQQLAKVKKLHMDMLMDYMTVPILSMPYIAVARKPWNFTMSKFHASTPFWMIQNESK